MEKRKTNKEALESLMGELNKCPLTNIEFLSDKYLELIAPPLGLFFDSFTIGQTFSFTTFFDSTFSAEDGNISFNGRRILRKNRYTRGELSSFLKGDELNPNKLASSSLPFKQELLLSSFKDQDDLYLSFGNLYYQSKERKSVSIAPLVFFKVKVRKEGNAYRLRLDYNAPLFNKPLIYKLKEEYQVGFDFDFSNFDFQKILDEARRKTARLSFGVDDSLFLLREDVFYWTRLAEVVSYAPKMASDPIFRSLEEELPKHTLQSYPSHNAHSSYVQNALNELAQNPLICLSDYDALSESFLKETIDEYILHKNTVAIVSPNKEKDNEWDKALLGDYYDAFMSYKSLTEPGSALFTIMEAAEKNPHYAVDAEVQIRKETLSELSQKHLEADRKIKSIGIVTQEPALEIYQNYKKALENKKRLYPFEDVKSYDFEDWLHDQEFLKFLAKDSDFRHKSFVKHPYYGLNSAVKADQYENIVSFLDNFIADIKAFEKSIDQAEVKTSGWSDFNSLRDYDEAVKLFSIYAQYDGFPASFFSVDFTPELVQEIDDLKEFYRLEASIKLSIDVLCRQEIWSFDFRQVMKDIEVRRKEKELRKKLKDVIKITPFRKSYKTLIILIDKYNGNRDKIEKILPSVRAVFHSQADTLDGLLSIDKAYEFIKSYQRHKKLYDHLNFSNPFTVKIFHDSEFSDKYRSAFYPSMMEKRSVIEHDFDKFRTVFNEDKFDYFNSSFSDIRHRLSERKDAPKEAFMSYLEFSKKCDDSSKPLRDAINLVEDREDNLDSFTDDYLASIYQFLMKRAMDESQGDKAVEDESAYLFDLYRYGMNGNDLLRLDTIKTFATLRELVLASPSYKQTIAELKEKYHYARMLPSNEALKIAGDVFFHLYPLQTVNMKQSEHLISYKFDLAIVDLRDDDSLLDLYSALMMANKVIVIGKDALKYRRSVKITFSLNKDMERFAKLRDTPDGFVKDVQKAFLRQGIELKINKRVEDLLVPYYFEKDGEKYALRFENGEDKLTYGDEYVLSLFLLKNLGLKTVYFYPLPFIVYPDLMVMSCFRDVKKVVEQMSQSNAIAEKMSYEQKKKAQYFMTLDRLDASFPKYEKAMEIQETIEKSPLTSSTKEERPITTISYLEIANGILVYLSRFTYLSRDTLIKHIGKVIGTDEKDVDFRLLFQRAENCLLEKNLIKADEGRLAKVRY